jgi:hypothetical protein
VTDPEPEDIVYDSHAAFTEDEDLSDDEAEFFSELTEAEIAALERDQNDAQLGEDADEEMAEGPDSASEDEDESEEEEEEEEEEEAGSDGEHDDENDADDKVAAHPDDGEDYEDEDDEYGAQ